VIVAALAAEKEHNLLRVVGAHIDGFRNWLPAVKRTTMPYREGAMFNLQLPNTFGVFLVLEILAAPFGYEGAGAIMNRQWKRAVVAYAIALPLAVGGLLALGVPILGTELTGVIGSFLISWLRPLSNPYFIVLLLVGLLVWIRFSDLSELKSDIKTVKAGMGASYWDVPPIRAVQGSVSPIVADLGLDDQIKRLSKQAPRHITPDQRKKFRDSLAGKTPIIWETFCVTTDSEADSYAKQLTRMFRDAGMNAGYSFSTDIDSDTLDQFGLTIHYKSGEFPEDARALAWAFDQAGIKYGLTSERVVPHADPRYVGLRIGRKPE
jgi:hypothetical protein